MSWARDVWPSERARLMSGHMMPIEREAAEATVEILEMNSWLEDDVKCGVVHIDSPDVPVCSIEVTHKLRDCTFFAPVCANTATYVQEAIDGGWECAGCGEPTVTHVRLSPI